ncbi:MAG: hypothetical protein MJ239_01890 [Bacilli bacterium]|nr:hypothetical protein [Bacilli bacterium]
MSRIKSHLLHFGILYLVAAIATPTIVCYAVDLKFKPKANEIFGVYIANGKSDVEVLYSYFEKKMPSTIKELDIFDYATSTRNAFDTFGKERSDLLIVPKSFIVDSVAKEIFTPVKPEMCGSYEPYRIDDSIYGVKVYDYATKKGVLKDMIPYEQDYFMFMNINSVHKSSILAQHSYDDLAITIWNEVLENETQI